MIKFVNAKINIGLQIVRRREDGYHELRTLFYPVGLYAGTPQNPEDFCDILEVIPVRGSESAKDAINVQFLGREIECDPEKNLVTKAARLYLTIRKNPKLRANIILEKHLPDGAGMGGGSADAAFTLLALKALEDSICMDDPGYLPCDTDELSAMALTLGADCPFFIKNRASFASGIGEKLEDIDLDLSGNWLLVVKPDIYISTKEAFSGVSPHPADFDLRDIVNLPISEWKDKVHNDFEDSIFPKYPAMSDIKEALYDSGALYASLTGSGSCIYGIYDNHQTAERAADIIQRNSTISSVYLLKL